MSLFSFLSDVGRQLVGGATAATPPNVDALKAELRRLGLLADGIGVTATGDTVHVTGAAPDADTHEKIVLALGNTAGVAHVDDQLTNPSASLLGTLGAFSHVPGGSADINAAATEVHGAAPSGGQQGPGGSVFYTVAKGDTLSAIAKRQYGDANAYMRIFEANKPMLDNPDHIYPGQVLRIPPKP